MKKQRTLKKVKFICDHCKKESGYYPQPDSADFKGRHPFPYDKGWIFMYNIEFKFKDHDVHDKLKHFCSKECFVNVIKQSLNPPKVGDKIKVKK